MKTKGFLIVLGILLLVLALMPYTVKAADSTESSVTLEKLEVTTPKTSTCKTGDKITIVATFSGEIVKGPSATDPRIGVSIGKSVYSENGTISGKTITFEYVVGEYDGGELKVTSLTLYGLTDKDGKTIAEPKTLPELKGTKLTINPVEWTDASKFQASLYNKYSADSDDSNDGYIKYSGLELKEKHEYYILLTNSSSEFEIPLKSGSSLVDTNDDRFLMRCSKSSMEDQSVAKWLELNGDIYLWLIEEQRDNSTKETVHKAIIKAKKLERPAQKIIGRRMSGFFFKNSTDIYLSTPRGYSLAKSTTRNVKIKVGKVTDQSILRSIKNSESGCLQKLMDYAKKADAVYTTTLAVKSGQDGITPKMNLVDDAYYFVYYQLDDENGKYYPGEEVSLYQACISDDLAIISLHNYLDDKFEWKLAAEPKPSATPTPKSSTTPTATPTPSTTDTTVADGKIPQTGESFAVIAIIGITMVVGIIGIVKYRKNNF